jgi:hypothetical protein
MIVVHVHGDGEFDKERIRDSVKPSQLKIRAPEEHCGVAERGIRTVKERTRCTVHSLPYDQYPRVMVRGLIERIAFMLNLFPSDHGVSTTLSPAEIVDGRGKFDFSKKHLPYGSYVQAYLKTTNNQEERSIEAIALRPANDQNGYYFMSLRTGQRIHSNKWDELPITQHVINKVHSLSEKENRHAMRDKELTFEWAPGVPIESLAIQDDDIEIDQDRNEINDLGIIQEEQEQDIRENEENDRPYVSDDESNKSEEHGIQFEEGSAINSIPLEDNTINEEDIDPEHDEDY